MDGEVGGGDSVVTSGGPAIGGGRGWGWGRGRVRVRGVGRGLGGGRGRGRIGDNGSGFFLMNIGK